MSTGQPLPHGRVSTSTEGGSAHASAVSEASARLRILVNLSRQLADAQPDLEIVLDTVCSHIVSELGDSCATFLLREDDVTLEPVTIRHRDPARCAVLEQIDKARKLRIGE